MLKKEIKYKSKSTKDTFKYARNLAKKILNSKTNSVVIGLTGNLGAGKTIFAKGFAHGLTIKDRINSPTFVFMKVYNIKKSINFNKFIHIDAYKLDNQKESIKLIGAEEYIKSPNSIALIEWAENIKKSLPKNTLLINIKNINEKERLIMHFSLK